MQPAVTLLVGILGVISATVTVLITAGYAERVRTLNKNRADDIETLLQALAELSYLFRQVVGALDRIVTNKERENKELTKVLMRTSKMSYDEYSERFSKALKQFEEGVRRAVWLNESESKRLKEFSEDLSEKWGKCKELVRPGEFERGLLEEPVGASKDAKRIQRWVATKLTPLESDLKTELRETLGIEDSTGGLAGLRAWWRWLRGKRSEVPTYGVGDAIAVEFSFRYGRDIARFLEQREKPSLVTAKFVHEDKEG